MSEFRPEELLPRRRQKELLVAFMEILDDDGPESVLGFLEALEDAERKFVFCKIRGVCLRPAIAADLTQVCPPPELDRLLRHAAWQRDAIVSLEPVLTHGPFQDDEYLRCARETLESSDRALSAAAKMSSEGTEWWERVKDPSPLKPDWEPLFSLTGYPKYFGET